MFDPLDLGEAVNRDLVQAPGEPGKGASLRLERGAAQVLEQVVVRVNPVERSARRLDLVEVPKVIVDEMM